MFISVPTRGQIQWQTVTRLEEIRDANPGTPPILYEPGNLSVALTRNKIVQKFLASECDVLVMVDDDVVPPPHFLESVLPISAEYGMVGIPYPLWQSGPGLFLSAFDTSSDGLRIATLLQGLNDVEAIGTGCVVIPSHVFDVLGVNPFRMENDPDATITSDDFLFCADLRGAGFKIGCWWDGWYADHIRAVGLAPLMESFTREKLTS